MNALTPYLAVKNAPKAIDFYQRAFGFSEVVRLQGPDGAIGHAELVRGDARLYLADEAEGVGHVSPTSAKVTTFLLSLAVDDVDLATKQAIDAGATLDREPADQFFGERTSSLVDPFGHRWSLHKTIETISAEEMKRRFDVLMKG